MAYREDLPGGCPPDEAKPQVKKLFRLIESFPPSESDFDSQWLERPDKRQEWKDMECTAKGISLYVSSRAARQRAKRKKMSRTEACEVNLTVESGPIKQTSGVHFTWWPLKDCKILTLCSETRYEN